MKQHEDFSIFISKQKVIIWSFIYFCIGILLYLIPAYFLFDITLINFKIESVILVVVLLSLGMFIHELLHGLGWVLSEKINWDYLRFGIYISQGVLYIHSMVPLRMKNYRIGILLPGIILGFIVPIIGLIFGWWLFVLLGIFMFSGASGDFIILWKTRKIPNDAYIVDHPKKIGLKAFMSPDKAKETKKENIKDINPNLINIKLFLIKAFTYTILFSLILVGIYYFGYLMGKYFA